MIEIKTLDKYETKVAAEIGKVLTSLTQNYSGEPLDKKWLESVIKSPWHDIFLAYDGDQLVGSATMSMIFSPTVGKVAYLEDMVVKTDIQSRGVGTALWNAIVKWADDKGARRIEFTSKKKREAAQQFYLKKGARIREETNPFRYEI